MAETRVKTYASEADELADQAAAAVHGWRVAERQPLGSGEVRVAYEYHPRAAEPRALWQEGRATAPAPAGTSRPAVLSKDERGLRLSREVQRWIGQGYRVQSADDYSTVLVKGHRVNHVLHAILTIFLLGLWLFVWIPVALLGGERRVQVTVSEQGDVRAYGV